MAKVMHPKHSFFDNPPARSHHPLLHSISDTPMLHEVLIVLAGHESPLITKHPDTTPIAQNGLLHKSEQALLAQAATLGELNAEVSRRIKWIQQLHRPTSLEHSKNEPWIEGPFPPSSHAVALTIDSQLIRPFRSRLVELERQILHSDSSYVGGKQIVSLSTIVAETVRQWERRFRYAQSLLGFLLASEDAKSSPRPCHQVLARLTKDSITGYQDVKTVVIDCIVRVERTWLQQLSCWVLYGKLPQYASGDFMIRGSSSSSASTSPVLYSLDESKVPPNCALNTARDIFAIGNCLAQLQTTGKTVSRQESNYLQTRIDLPIQRAQLSRVMTEIKTAVYKDVVGVALPLDSIRQFFDILVKIPLLESADFSLCLVNSTKWQFDSIKDPREYFRRALSDYLEDSHATAGNGPFSDEMLTRMFQLFPVKESHQQAYPDRFDDLLTGVRCKMLLGIEWPYSILVSESDRQRYSFVFAYLIALRKVHVRISSLWGCGSVRRSSSNRQRDESAIRLWQLANKVKLVLDTLWDYSQSVVIAPLFRETIIKELADQSSAGAESGVDPQQIMTAHSQFLSEICRLLFVDNEDMRRAMRRLLINCMVLVERLSKEHYEVPGDLEPAMLRVLQAVEQTPEFDSKINLLLLKLEFLK